MAERFPMWLLRLTQLPSSVPVLTGLASMAPDAGHLSPFGARKCRRRWSPSGWHAFPRSPNPCSAGLEVFTGSEEREYTPKKDPGDWVRSKCEINFFLLPS